MKATLHRLLLLLLIMSLGSVLHADEPADAPPLQPVTEDDSETRAEPTPPTRSDRVRDARDRRRGDGLLRPATPEMLLSIESKILEASIPVRVTEDLGHGYRPRYVTHESVAIWLAVPDSDEVLLVSPNAVLVRASKIEIWLDDEWQEAERRWATTYYDLAALHMESLSDHRPARALIIADEWPANLQVHTASPIEAEPQASSSTLQASDRSASRLASGAMEAEPDPSETYYARSPFVVYNGYPLVDDRGELVAISSVLPAGRRERTLAVPAGAIREWLEARPRIGEAGSISPEPRVIRQGMQLRSGSDAFEDTPNRNRAQQQGDDGNGGAP